MRVVQYNILGLAILISLSRQCKESVGSINPTHDGLSAYILQGTTQSFRCMSHITASFDWAVQIGGDDFGTTDVTFFDIKGVSWTEDSSSNSILTLDLGSGGHFTGIRCIIRYHDGQIPRKCSIFIAITIYSVPMPPTNITLDPLSSGAVNVSWQTNPTDVITSFELTVTVSSISYVYQTTDTFYILSLNGSFCEKYELNVSARNDGGSNSTAITSYLPWLPDVSVVESSLQHTVIKSESRVSVTITHQAAIVCEDDDISYTLHMSSGDIHPTSEIGGVITYTLNSSHGLEDDARYEYNISAANVYGEVYTQPKNLYTSDVQSVCGYLEGSEVTILCMFAEGSPASGCKVSLITNTSNITTNIVRDSISTSAGRVITVNAPLTNTSRLYASDLESDGSISTLYLPGSLSTDSPDCKYLQLLSGQDVSLLIIAVVVPATSVILLVGIAIIIFILILYRKARKGSFVPDHKDISTTENPAYSVSGTTRSSKTSPSIDSDKELTEPVYAVIADL